MIQLNNNSTSIGPPRRKRTINMMIALLTLVLLAASCGSDSATSSSGSDDGSTTGTEDGTSSVDSEDESAQQTTGGTLTIASTTPIALWDLASSTANETAAFAYPLVFGFMMQEVDGELVPDLLESAEPSEDLTSWTLMLREGLMWSDGSPVTSADLKFTLDRLAADVQFSYLIGTPDPADIVVVDDRTVEMALAAPNAEIATLGLSATTENLYKADFGGMTEEEYFLNPIGAGPFVVDSNSDSGMTLTKNENYWDAENIALDSIEVIIVADNNAKLIGFEAGDYDIVTRQPTSVISQLEDAGTALVINPSANVDTIFLNQGSPPFDDVNFRRAVWYAIDRETIAAGVFDGNALPAMGMIPSALRGATPGANPPAHDPVKAAEFLSQSAYVDDATFDLLLVDGDGARREEAQIIADQLSEVGITANVTPLGFAEWSEQVFGAQHQASLFGYEAVVSPPSDIIGFFAATAGFFGNYDTTNAFGQFAALQASADEAAKSAVISEFETEFGDQAYSIPVVEPFWVIGVADRVSGLHVPATGIPDLARVTVAEG